MRTAAGPQRFRIALWRQRKGERIRIVGAFATLSTSDTEPAEMVGAQLAAPARDSATRHAVLVATALRPSLAALLHKAERLRADAPHGAAQGMGAETGDPAAANLLGNVRSHASDILATGWRLMRLADELLVAAGSGASEPTCTLSETEPVQLLRRIARLNHERLAERGAELRLGTALDSRAGVEAPRLGALRIVIDESRLWSAVEGVLWCLAEGIDGGARLTLDLAGTAEDGIAVLVRSERAAAPAGCQLDPGIGGGPWLTLGDCARLLRSTGAAMETIGEAGSMTVRMRIPPARCLGAL